MRIRDYSEEKLASLSRDLAAVFNSHSVQSGSITPDYVLAAFALTSILAFEEAIAERAAQHALTEMQSVLEKHFKDDNYDRG